MWYQENEIVISQNRVFYSKRRLIKLVFDGYIQVRSCAYWVCHIPDCKGWGVKHENDIQKIQSSQPWVWFNSLCFTLSFVKCRNISIKSQKYGTGISVFTYSSKYTSQVTDKKDCAVGFLLVCQNWTEQNTILFTESTHGNMRNTEKHSIRAIGHITQRQICSKIYGCSYRSTYLFHLDNLLVEIQQFKNIFNRQTRFS